MLIYVKAPRKLRKSCSVTGSCDCSSPMSYRRLDMRHVSLIHASQAFRLWVAIASPFLELRNSGARYLHRTYPKRHFLWQSLRGVCHRAVLWLAYVMGMSLLHVLLLIFMEETGMDTSVMLWAWCRRLIILYVAASSVRPVLLNMLLPAWSIQISLTKSPVKIEPIMGFSDMMSDRPTRRFSTLPHLAVHAYTPSQVLNNY